MGDLLVLWDVDGTLLNAGGVGGDLYEMVFLSMFGRPCEQLPPMAGRTDRAIILDTLEMSGISESRRHVDAFIEGLRSHAPGMFEAAKRQGRALPGAAEALMAVASARVSASTIGFAVCGTALAGPGCAADADPLTRGPAAGPETAGPEAAADGGPGGIPVSYIPAPARVAAGSVPAGASVAAAAGPLGASAEAQPAAAVLPLAVPAETVLPPASLPVSAPLVQVAPHPANRPAAGPSAASPSAASPSADGRRHPVTTAADLSPRAARRPAESGRAYQSVLTGNVRTLAEVKLSAVGLRHPLDLCIGAYGDDHEVRAELVHLARRRASAVHGRPPSDFGGQATVVVGDTPLDILAALAAGARAVGVATGDCPAAALLEAGAHAVLADLTNTAAVLSALLA
jgi:phosphoglycolate phosphatase-like HAD superfamily hydrolase